MIVALSFPGCNRRGGVERILYECAHFLASRDHDVTVFANDWDADNHPHIKYQFVPMRQRPGFMRPQSYFRNFTRLAASNAHDVLSTHGCVCPVGGVHWVQSLHRAWLEQCRKFRAPLSSTRLKQRLNPLHPVLLKLEARHFANCDYRKVIATTEVVRADLNRFYGVPVDDVVLVPNGFQPGEFNPERRSMRRSEMRSALGLQPNEIALLFVGNELDRKGYGTVLAALSHMKRNNVRLLVVGRYREADAHRAAERLGVADQVMLCGATTDVAGYHAACDLFVLPTQYEAFCLAILEALGSGLPVVTTGVPGARDTIQEGVNGELLDDQLDSVQLAAILETVLAPSELERLSAQAPGTVSQFQWPAVLERYEQTLMLYSD